VPKVRYVDGPTIELEEGETILQASLRCGVDHRNACDGVCRCSTCRVEIVEGAEHLADADEEECEILAINNLDAPVRLACGLRPTGDVTVRVLMRESDEALPPSLAQGLAQEREIAVLFADIRNFTPFAEQQLPFDVLHLLNRYFDRMGTVIDKFHGHIVSYQGDGIVALFPAGGDTSALEAVHCGLDMLEARESLAEYAQEHFSFEMRMGIGIDFGRALVGQIGYYRNTQLNAIGDVVNTASRVQDLTKEMGVEMLIAAAVLGRLRDRFATGQQLETEIRGKAGRHTVIEVLGTK
jgi:adenylate cyclase